MDHYLQYVINKSIYIIQKLLKMYEIWLSTVDFRYTLYVFIS